MGRFPWGKSGLGIMFCSACNDSGEPALEALSLPGMGRATGKKPLPDDFDMTIVLLTFGLWCPVF